MTEGASMLTLIGPYQGPCGICGGPDARHRVADSIAEQVRAGDSPERVADDFGVDLAAVRFLAEHWDDEVPTRSASPFFKEVAKNELIADAARAYCAAWIQNRDADPAHWLSARCELDRTLDAMLTECGHEGFGVEE